MGESGYTFLYELPTWGLTLRPLYGGCSLSIFGFSCKIEGAAPLEKDK